MRYACSLLAVVVLLLANMACAAPSHSVRVLASIKPLALIAREVVGPDAKVDTLLPPGVSPHNFALRVSDMRRIQRADLNLWVGPALENFLQKTLERLPASKVLSAAHIKGLHWPPSQSSTVDHGHEHHHGADMHIWLNPQNAALIAAALAQRLAQLRPARAQAFKQRAKAFGERMTALDKKLQKRLKPAAGRGFTVYHDGYRHFVDHYGLQQVDYVALTPERHPGARHLYQLQRELKSKAVCLFVEPYGNEQAARNLAANLHLRTGKIDPLGSSPAITRYTELMQTLASAFLSCLLVQ